MTGGEPLVSVVTPFYNTRPYLAECIESVLRQSYQNWEYALVNNCSTDGSAEIADRYARLDSRIRVLNNASFIGQVANYNGALAHISPDSRYCKVVEADNWIFPNCLEEMVALAEAQPSVGIIGCQYHEGTRVTAARLEHASPAIDGKTACKMNLVDGVPLFGAPTNLLLRSSIVRGRRPFYDPNSLHPDKDVCYSVLQQWNFGYVPQPLAFIRVDEKSISANLRELGTYDLQRFVLLQKYGRLLFPQEVEFRKISRQIERQHATSLVKRVLTSRRRRDVWRVHCQSLSPYGYELSWKRLLPLVTLAVVRRVFGTWSLAIAGTHEQKPAR